MVLTNLEIYLIAYILALQAAIAIVGLEHTNVLDDKPYGYKLLACVLTLFFAGPIVFIQLIFKTLKGIK